MTHTYVLDDLAGFVVAAGQADLAGRSRAMLKRNVLDSIACAIVHWTVSSLRRFANTPHSSVAARRRHSLVAGALRSIRPRFSMRCWCVTPICSTPI